MSARTKKAARRKGPAYLGPSFLAATLGMVVFGILPLILIAVVGLVQGTVPSSDDGGVLGAAPGYPLVQPPFWLLWAPAAVMVVLSIVTWPLPERFPQFFWGARFDMSVVCLVGAGITLTAAIAYGAPLFMVLLWCTAAWVLAVVLFGIRGLVTMIGDAASAFRPARTPAREDEPR